MKPTDVVRGFIDRINAADVPGIVDWMTPDHRFTDSGDTVIVGREAMGTAWEAYFRMFPDYRIEPQTWLEDGDTVVVLGHASGTYAVSGRLAATSAWRIPAAWRAVVRGEHVAAWQVYADNDPVRRIVESASSSE